MSIFLLHITPLIKTTLMDFIAYQYLHYKKHHVFGS